MNYFFTPWNILKVWRILRINIKGCNFSFSRHMPTFLWIRTAAITAWKVSYLELFWSVFSHIWTWKPPNTDTFHAVDIFHIDRKTPVFSYPFRYPFSRSLLFTLLIYFYFYAYKIFLIQKQNNWYLSKNYSRIKLCCDLPTIAMRLTLIVRNTKTVHILCVIAFCYYFFNISFAFKIRTFSL